MTYIFQGYGSSAVVYLAKHKITGRQVAVKLIDLDQFERNQIDELRVCFFLSYSFRGKFK
jgi:hypothetical protein